MLADLAPRAGFDYEVAVLGISVAALMHAEWVRRKLTPPPGIDRIILPGWCQGDLAPLSEAYGVPVERGPKDLLDLPDHFGRQRAPIDYGAWNIEILAEINHAPRLPPDELLARALNARAAGADVIDVGCIPGESWAGVGDAVRRLRDAGLRVSIDSFDRAEVEAAVAAGAELVLSCNGTNVAWAADLPAELVVVPDDIHDAGTLDAVAQTLLDRGRPLRLDPVLEPIGFGFAASLGRYLEVRRRWPGQGLMMGIGNLTELTEVDSAGINVLLAGFCEELEIKSVLTTEVVNWARSAVAEFDVARRLVRHAVTHSVLPKHVDSRLVLLRDPQVRPRDPAELAELAAQLRDASFRIFVERGEIHVMNRDGYWRGTDPFGLFDQLPPVDASHAFYLGYELAKAVTALTLGKNYRQDEALRWGFLTRPEISAHDRRKGAADS